MQDKILLLNMSGVYDKYDFYKDQIYSLKDFTSFEGINGYLSDQSRTLLEGKLQDSAGYRLRFIDNGNFHYLSLLLLKDMKEDFELILFDKHPDCKMPAFGEIVSCGSWVKWALGQNSFLKKVYMVGVDKKLYDELEDLGSDKDKVVMVDDILYFQEHKVDSSVYISIDKDVMSKEYASCVWDQGDMSLDNILAMIEDISRQTLIPFIDICGEGAVNDCDRVFSLNNHTNAILLENLAD